MLGLVIMMLPSEAMTYKSHQEEYKLSCKLTEEAAEKAQNEWWTARAVEAERHAWVAEQLGISGAESVRWFKSLFDANWHEEEVLEDGKNQLLIPLHKKCSCTICDYNMALPSLVPPASHPESCQTQNRTPPA